MDNYLLCLINGLPHPSWLEKIVLILDAGGHFEIMLGVAFLMGFLGFVKKDRRILWGAFLLVLTLVSTSFLVFIIKHWVHRPRPFITNTGLQVLGAASGGSFPSGHAALYGTLGSFMIFYFKKWKTVWAGLIFLGGLARIYQGVHYPTDVLAGWGVAFLVVGCILKLHRTFFVSFFKTHEL